ncbi:hypothetical protein A2801_02140 [Candidatus Woesebacteria bacterium RIFCSPHIGHO2_01_FULL_41_10]|uniref:BioF2-like acetyltransferase domain-containing protein n=1 Tax=Candidatus Woesebacteria bacterium RIFCSPHIGHO2_01_FULL_41_10 TaxID=1802500 RepID=A0A1F7YPU2_9BACT|nr:MAG: hypothetical protein A2801_02140 [Candidatus Woesebacteria bacterium RIFCSPHIGHO2_01_FULL_41_10]
MDDIRQNTSYANYLSHVGWRVNKIEDVTMYIREIPLCGTFVKVQRPDKLSQKVITKALLKHKPFRIVVEPKNDMDAKKLEDSGFKQTKTPFVPSKTILLDLIQTPEKLLSQMSKDARTSIKKTDNLALVETTPEDFRQRWRASVPIKRYVMSIHDLDVLKDSFGENVLFLTTKSGGSGGLFLFAQNIGYYWQGFTSKTERQTLAQYQVVWQGILWAKKRGAKQFDFEGIFDERFPISSWHGFTAFKKKFGGQVTQYPGAYEKIYWRNWRLF